MTRVHAEVTRAGDVLNALSGSIAVLDATGLIVSVNEAWRAFGRANGCSHDNAFIGVNYLDVCERAAAHDDAPLLRDFAAALRRVIRGEQPTLHAEYPCHSPAGERWFQVRVTALAEAGGFVVHHEDITTRKLTERQLEERAQMLRAVLEALPVGVWLMNEEGRIVEGNAAGRAIWGGARYVGPEDFGEFKGWWHATGRQIEPDEWAASRAMRDGETSIDEEIDIECFDGTRKVILNSAIPLTDERRGITGAIIVNQDITARVRADEELHRAKEAVEQAGRELAEVLIRERTLARVDPLTGALNRRRFFELAEYEISVAMRYHRELSIILFDLDDFKATNDRLGHHAGDELLKSVVQVVGSHLRQADVLARYGGDEFIILLPHTRAEDAAIVAERIRTDISEQRVAVAGGVIVSAQISAGIAEYAGPGDQLDTLVQRADVALYEAKNQGRNRVATFRGNGSRHS